MEDNKNHFPCFFEVILKFLVLFNYKHSNTIESKRSIKPTSPTCLNGSNRNLFSLDNKHECSGELLLLDQELHWTEKALWPNALAFVQYKFAILNLFPGHFRLTTINLQVIPDKRWDFRLLWIWIKLCTKVIRKKTAKQLKWYKLTNIIHWIGYFIIHERGDFITL